MWGCLSSVCRCLSVFYSAACLPSLYTVAAGEHLSVVVLNRSTDPPLVCIKVRTYVLVDVTACASATGSVKCVRQCVWCVCV